jgi:hypothetical protein
MEPSNSPEWNWISLCEVMQVRYQFVKVIIYTELNEHDVDPCGRAV